MIYATLGAIALAQDDTGTETVSDGNFDPTAWIALALSIVGLVVTVFLRYLDGPRVRVRMRPILFNVGMLGGTITYHGGKWPIPAIDSGIAMKRPDPGEVIELAEIVIENAGRQPMTVHEIGFHWLSERKGWRRRRVRNSSVPVTLRPPYQEGRVFADGDQFRIEPSDVVTVLVNYWDLIRTRRPSAKGRIDLRAGVRVAGRRRIKLSPRKLRWRIPDSAVTSVGVSRKVPLRAVITKSVGLALLLDKQETLGDIYFLSRSLEAAMEGAWSDDWRTNHERLRHFQENSSVHFAIYDKTWAAHSLMFNVHRAIDDHKDIIDWADIAQPGLHKMFSTESRTEVAAAKADAAIQETQATAPKRETADD